MLKKPKFDITKLNEMYSEKERVDKDEKNVEDDKEAENLLNK